MRSMDCIMFFAICCLAIPFFIPCQCLKCRAEKPTVSSQSTNEWQQGDFITFRRIYPHPSCGGQMVFNGQSDRVPLSENAFMYTHVCDRCSVTNKMLNQTWPQFKREWRPK